MLSEPIASNAEAVTKAELITDENRGLIGKEITNNEPAEANPPGHNEDDRKEGEKTTTIPENNVITEAEETVLIPATISVFETEDNVTPEVIMPNGSCAVFVPSTETKGWTCQKGEVLQFTFEKYDSDTSIEQPIIVGVVYNGTMLEGERSVGATGEYLYKVGDQGNYAVYVISATSDYLSLKEGKVSVK